MNPNSGENAGFEAPTQPVEAESTASENIEKSIKTPEDRPQAQKPAVASQDVSAIAVPSQVTAQTFADDQTAGQPVTTSSAHNSDRIERQWIDRAKAVVAQTKDDPYRQKTEISKVKADYIKQRFDKTIRTDDAVTK